MFHPSTLTEFARPAPKPEKGEKGVAPLIGVFLVYSAQETFKNQVIYIGKYPSSFLFPFFQPPLLFLF
jgi:hypothetical protein